MAGGSVGLYDQLQVKSQVTGLSERRLHLLSAEGRKRHEFSTAETMPWIRIRIRFHPLLPSMLRCTGGGPSSSNCLADTRSQGNLLCYTLLPKSTHRIWKSALPPPLSLVLLHGPVCAQKYRGGRLGNVDAARTGKNDAIAARTAKHLSELHMSGYGFRSQVPSCGFRWHQVQGHQSLNAPSFQRGRYTYPQPQVVFVPHVGALHTPMLEYLRPSGNGPALGSSSGLYIAASQA